MTNEESQDESATALLRDGLHALVKAAGYKTKKAEGRVYSMVRARNLLMAACEKVEEGEEIDLREVLLPHLREKFPEIGDLIKNTFGHYQQQAESTAIYPGRDTFMGLIYCALKLAGEAGEVSEKVGKIIRDNNSEVTEEKRLDLLKELGDVQWYIAMCAYELNTPLIRVAQMNLEKLASRKARGKLGGSGDDR